MVNPGLSRQLQATLHAAAGNLTVEYVAGAMGTIPSLPVVAGDSEFEVSVDGGYSTIKTRSYLIALEDLDIGGAKFLPQRGHRIRETDPLGKTQTYEVMLPGDGRQWEPWDNAQTSIDVHAKLIDQA